MDVMRQFFKGSWAGVFDEENNIVGQGVERG
jgi:hypothetical protein